MTGSLNMGRFAITNIKPFVEDDSSQAASDAQKNQVINMYLLTEWEGRTGKYLARGQGVRTERSEVRTS